MSLRPAASVPSSMNGRALSTLELASIVLKSGPSSLLRCANASAKAALERTGQYQGKRLEAMQASRNLNCGTSQLQLVNLLSLCPHCSEKREMDEVRLVLIEAEASQMQVRSGFRRRT